MIIAVYKDDGPLQGGGQDIGRTAPQEKAVPFPDYAAFRLADNRLSEETAQRKNPRHIKWYEVEGVIAATVRDALAELRADALRLPTADYSTDGDGAELIKQDAVLKLIDAAMTALGLGAEGERR